MTTQNIDRTLQRLALTFSVRDIMIAEPDLKYADDESSAKALLDECPNFDVIPIRQDSRLTAYLERGTSQVRRIKMSDVISDGTIILDVVDALTQHRFCFVLVGQKVGGFVHFSGLNNPIVKLPYLCPNRSRRAKVGARSRSTHY